MAVTARLLFALMLVFFGRFAASLLVCSLVLGCLRLVLCVLIASALRRLVVLLAFFACPWRAVIAARLAALVSPQLCPFRCALCYCACVILVFCSFTLLSCCCCCARLVFASSRCAAALLVLRLIVVAVCVVFWFAFFRRFRCAAIPLTAALARRSSFVCLLFSCFRLSRMHCLSHPSSRCYRSAFCLCD